MNRYVHTTIKMSVASFVTIMIANVVDLDYPITAGILAVLSVQLTRTDSYVLAIKRLLDAMIAIILFTFMFVLIDYTVIVFAVTTVLFIALSFKLKVSVGIVPGLVLASHLLLYNEYAFEHIGNSVLLIVIASSVALLLNLFYPLNTKETLVELVKEIDGYIKKDLSQLTKCLSSVPDVTSSLEQHENIHEQLEAALDQAQLTDKDILFANDHLHLSYIQMRHAQMKSIHQIYTLLIKIEYHHPHVDVLAKYIRDLIEDIGRANMATKQKAILQTIKAAFQESDLPKTRNEFETRAILYQMMFELVSFLDEKIHFHQKHGILE